MIALTFPKPSIKVSLTALRRRKRTESFVDRMLSARFGSDASYAVGADGKLTLAGRVRRGAYPDPLF